jgi:hypothetical protein
MFNKFAAVADLIDDKGWVCMPALLARLKTDKPDYNGLQAYPVVVAALKAYNAAGYGRNWFKTMHLDKDHLRICRDHCWMDPDLARLIITAAQEELGTGVPEAYTAWLGISNVCGWIRVSTLLEQQPRGQQPWRGLCNYRQYEAIVDELGGWKDDASGESAWARSDTTGCYFHPKLFKAYVGATAAATVPINPEH